MRTLLITAVLALSVCSSAFAFESNDVDCPAFAESNKRESKEVKLEEAKEIESVNAKGIQD